MKKIISLFFLLVLSNTSFCDKKIIITQFCEHYHQRSYFILRLEKIIESIKKNNKKKYTYSFNQEQFSSPSILPCLQKIQKRNSLQPFYNLWEEVKHYKYLEEKPFAHDFTKLLFSIQHTIYSHNIKTKGIPSFDIKFSLEGRSYTEATTVRNYYFKRLRCAFLLLKNVPCSKQSLFDAESTGCDCTFITHHTFLNKDIKKCIKQMERQQSVKPLIALSKDFYSCKLIQDIVFLREFITLTFIVLRNIFINNIHAPFTSVQKKHTNHIAHIYQNLDKLPLEEILEAIDLLHKELPALLEKYQFNSKMKWRTWLKKYWWVPPTLLTVFGIRILWIFKNPDKPPANPLIQKKE